MLVLFQKEAGVTGRVKPLALEVTEPLTSSHAVESDLPLERLRMTEAANEFHPFVEYIKLWSFQNIITELFTDLCKHIYYLSL